MWAFLKRPITDQTRRRLYSLVTFAQEIKEYELMYEWETNKNAAITWEGLPVHYRYFPRRCLRHLSMYLWSTETPSLTHLSWNNLEKITESWKHRRLRSGFWNVFFIHRINKMFFMNRADDWTKNERQIHHDIIIIIIISLTSIFFQD